MTDMLAFAHAFASPEGGEAHGVVRALALARLKITQRRIAAALENRGLIETAQALSVFAARDYRPALNESKTLTEAGRTLWSSLCRAVDAALEN